MFKSLLILLTLFVTQASAVLADAPVVVVGQPIVIVDHAQAPRAPTTYTDAEITSIRAQMGIQEVVVSDQSLKVFRLRNEGVFVISNNNYTNSVEAKAFCDAVSDVTPDEVMPFDLINTKAALGLVFMGLPFRNVLEAAEIIIPVIDHEGMRTGVAFWTYGFGNSIDANQVMTFTDGNGAGAGDFQDLAALNARLVGAGSMALEMPAICFDKKLQNYLAN